MDRPNSRTREYATDLLLFFPGVTEARHFPYMSLPQLTAHARAQGLRTEQRDLNLQLARDLLRPVRLLQRLENSPSLSPLGAASLRYLLDDDRVQATPPDIAVRVRLNALEAQLAGSALLAPVTALNDAMVQARTPLVVGDLAASVYENLVRTAMTDLRPRVVGFSIAFFSQLVPALRAALIVRQEDPQCTIVFGGQQIMMRASLLQSVEGFADAVDILCTSPGETVLKDIVEAHRSGVRSAGVTVTSHPSSDWKLADNPPPNFDGLAFEDYFVVDPQLPVVSCVGCYWGRCTFCSYGNRSMSEGYQQLHYRQLADNVCDGLSRTGARRVTFVDENSNINLLLKAMEQVKQRGFQVHWSTRNRMESCLSDPAFCQRLATSGCVMMSVGYETNSQRVLDKLDKGVSAATYQTIVDNLDAVGITLRVSILGGIPEETHEEASESKEFIRRNADKLGIDVAQLLIVEPGTRLDEAIGTPLGADDHLVDNSGFSYLGGRVGRSPTYAGTDTRVKRATALRELLSGVHPGKNDEKHPRHRPAVQSQPTQFLHLHPWISTERDDEITRLLDVRWLIRYRTPRGVLLKKRVLWATDEASAAALGVMATAGLGCPAMSSDPDLSGK